MQHQIAPDKLAAARPFEIAYIRPPTENCSLGFRLTRNCYWNKCGFCPVYKFGFRFSRRSPEAVIEDVRRAARLDSLLDEAGIGRSPQNDSARAAELIRAIQQVQGPAQAGGPSENKAAFKDLDPVLAWFLQWIKEAPGIEDCIEHLLSFRLTGGRTCFLGDADGLIVAPAMMESVIAEIGKHFPAIDRFTVYGRTATAARRRSANELERLQAAGVNRVHFGIESGSDAVLDRVNKGETAADHVAGCRKTIDAGLSCSTYVMPGLGGKELSERHACETADVLTRIAPDYIRIRSLQIFPQTPLAAARDAGEFVEVDETGMVEEIRTLVENIDAPTEIFSDSASNLLNINGRLPNHRRMMLYQIDQFLDLSEREKRLFSLRARLRAFEGQYGGISKDIYDELKPYLKNGGLDAASVPDEAADAMIARIKSKLMP
ncbi:MAG: radical SAM protein [Thermodesulfobacteriota bacterium]